MAKYGTAALLLLASMMMQKSAAVCPNDLINSVYCPFHDVSILVQATNDEANELGDLVNPNGGSSLQSLADGYAYLYDGVNNPYNRFKTYPSYAATKSETLMCYENYYGPNYHPNTVVKAALDRNVINFPGPALTQDYSDATRTGPEYYIAEESAKKINQYTTALLEMYQLMEQALRAVLQGCISIVPNGNMAGCDNAVEIWDNAAAIQTGPNVLGEKRCLNYLTCGFNWISTNTIALANIKVLNLFQLGQTAVRTGDCCAIKAIIKLIQSAQLIPYIQGVARYAWKISNAAVKTLAANNKWYAEGAAFATGMLPQLYKCNMNAATVVDKRFQLEVGNQWGSGTFLDFMNIIRAEYPCLCITCEDVGGLWDGAAYYPGAEPCVTNYGSYSAC